MGLAKVVYLLLDEHKVSSEDFDGEMVAVNFSTGKYYGMKGCAHDIWRMLGTPVSVDEISSGICDIYGTKRAEVQGVITEFIETLRTEDILLEISERPANGHVFCPTSLLGQAYEAPVLEIYSDLQELIMLDPVHEADPEQGWPLRRQAEDG